MDEPNIIEYPAIPQFRAELTPLSDSADSSNTSLSSLLSSTTDSAARNERQRRQPRKKRKARNKVGRNSIVVKYGLSEETRLLMEEIRQQLMMFEDRTADRICSKMRVTDLIGILNAHGIVMERTPRFIQNHYQNARSHFSPVRNLKSCLKDIRLLEDSHGKELWILQILVLHNLIVDMNPILAVDLFRSSIIHIYMGCADAINKRNWPMIAKLVSDIQFSYHVKTKNCAAVPFSEIKYKKTLLKLGNNTNFISFYLTSLFLASVQRNLQLAESPELTLGLIDETIRLFELTCDTRKSLWVNPSSFFMLNGLIYKVCHGFYDNASRIIDAPLLQINPDWQRIFFVYKLVSEYEIFCLDKTPMQAQSLLSSVEGQIGSLQHREHTLILLPILVELCVYLGDGELLFEVLSNLCMDSPILLPHVCQILVANGCQDAPLSLFESLIAAKVDRLAVVSVTPSLLKLYSEDPGKHGAINEVVKTNLEVAFKVLDYGRNRNNVDAWHSLHINLKYVESQPEIANQFWTPRKTWWPQFHSSITNIECRKLKKKCYKRLNSNQLADSFF